MRGPVAVQPATPREGLVEDPPDGRDGHPGAVPSDLQARKAFVDSRQLFAHPTRLGGVFVVHEFLARITTDDRLGRASQRTDLES